MRPPRQGDLDQQRGADTSPPVPRRRRNRSTSSADTSTGPASPSTSYENDDARSASIDSPVPVRGVARPRVVPLPAIKSGAASYAASVKAFSASGMKSGSASGYHPPSVYSYTSARSAPDQHYQFMSHHDVLPPDDVDSSEKSSEFGMRYTHLLVEPRRPGVSHVAPAGTRPSSATRTSSGPSTRCARSSRSARSPCSSS